MVSFLAALMAFTAQAAHSRPIPADSSDPVSPHFNRTLSALRLPPSVSPPAIDGDLSDPAWKSAAHATVFYDPQSGQPVPDQTEVHLIYDAKYIYVGFYCHDSHPESITARETVRDANINNDDNFQVTFDPYLTRKFEDYDVFRVNALGTRSTYMSGGRANKLEWQGDWAAATRRVADGWTGEMRIPWSILNCPRSARAITCGLNFRRYQTRTHIQSLWSDLGPQYFNERDGQWTGLEPPSNAWRPRFSALPYMLPIAYGGGGRNTSNVRMGLDARYQPNPEITSVTTLNPDFQSVEGAVEGVGFTRTERYVPDLRPFFLEGSDVISLGESYQLGQLIDTENIQSVDVGQKIYGKLDPKTTLGMLSTVGFGREADFAATVRREFNDTSNVKMLMIQRLVPEGDNTVFAIAPQERWGKWSIDGQFVQTLGPGAGGRGYTAAVNLSDKNLFTTIRYLWVSPLFVDTLGYIPWTDFQGFSSYTQWQGRWDHGFLRDYDVEFNPEWDWHLDGRPNRRDANLWISFNTRSDYNIAAYINGGMYDDSRDLLYGLQIGGDVSNRFRQWSLNASTGIQGDEPTTTIGPTFHTRVFRRFDFSVGSYLQNRLGITSQHIMTFNYEMSPYKSWGRRAVINQGVVNVFFSFKNAGRRGTDTYFIIGDPNAASFQKQVMLKLVFAIG
jgi:hypothetical protein